MSHYTRSILIVDDDAIVRRLLRRLLAAAGFFALEASSMEEARERLRRGPVRGVLLDLILDGGNGWEHIGELRALTAAPIVVMTGASVDSDTVKDARLLGAQGMLGKPFTSEELLTALAASGIDTA